jgi:hypothetical protein
MGKLQAGRAPQGTFVFFAFSVVKPVFASRATTGGRTVASTLDGSTTPTRANLLTLDP